MWPVMSPVWVSTKFECGAVIFFCAGYYVVCPNCCLWVILVNGVRAELHIALYVACIMYIELGSRTRLLGNMCRAAARECGLVLVQFLQNMTSMLVRI